VTETIDKTGPLAIRAILVDALLAARPELAESGTDPAALATRAQLHHVATAVPAATAELLGSLREYLARPVRPWRPTA